MADTSIAVTPGSGSAVDTRTEGTNGNHRQVIVIGDPATNAGVAPVDVTAGLKVDLGTDNDVTVTSGSVTVSAVTPGTGASNLGKAEDAVHSSGDIGVMALTVRQDTATALGQTDGDYQPAVTDSSGRLHVNVGVSALPSGSSTSAKQDTIIGHLDGVEGILGTIDTDTGTIAGAVSGSEMQVDIVSAPTLTVNSHAVTNAGTFAVQVDGNALTALQLIDDTVATLGTTTYSEATTKGNVIGAVRRDADTTLIDTTNEIGPLQMDANGRLKVEAFSGETLPVSLTSTTVTGTVAVTQSGTWDEVGINDSGNSITVDGTVTANLSATDNTVLDNIDTSTSAMATSLGSLDNSVDGNYLNVNMNVAGTDVVSGSGTATGALRVELPTNGTGVIATVGAVTAITNALPAGTNAIGKLSANSGVDIGDVDVTSISAGTNAIGNVGLIGRTSGGLSIFRSIDLDETEEEVKATAGQVFSITAFNRTASPLYLKFYNATTANVTVGTTTPVMTFVVPANADSDGAGFIHSTDIGYAFGTAITVACTTGIADNDTGAPGANDCVVNIGYV